MVARNSFLKFWIILQNIGQLNKYDNVEDFIGLSDLQFFGPHLADERSKDFFESVERWDREKRRFVSDYQMLNRISEDTESERLDIRRFWKYIAFFRNFSLN